MRDMWPEFSELVATAERPARYIDHEWGAEIKDAPYNFCMVYPDTYEIGQANQAVRILCNVVNATEGLAAQRAFLPAPDLIDRMREAGVPLCSLETCSPLADFDCVGVTLPHELAATNVLEALDLGGIPVLASERGESDPIVFAGGPCAFNPEPYAPFVDVFSLGEGEEAVVELMQLHSKIKREGGSRADFLRAIALREGFYVPGLYDWRDEEEAQRTGSWIAPREEGLPTTFVKRIYDGFADSPGFEPCIVPFTEVVHDRLNVEVLRGCTRGCRFCQAGMMYRPVRERSADNIVKSVLEGLEATGYDEVSLTSLSTTDHSQIAEILTRLNDELAGTGIRVSIPSQRLDSFGVSMAGLVAGGKKGGLTFAPEAGTQRLRDVINKGVTEEDLVNAVDAAFREGWRRCKLYFMIGLPTETDEDIVGIAELLERAYRTAQAAVPEQQKGSIKISASVALFVPKAQTPFQWDGQIPAEEAYRRVRLLKDSVKRKAIDVRWHDPKTSFVEAVMSRGGRECAAWVHEAWKRGARFDAWTELFDEDAWRDAAAHLGLDVDATATTSYPTTRVMPWDHVSAGVTTSFFARERKLAERGVVTPDCSFERCSACGVCYDLDVDIVTREPRVG